MGGIVFIRTKILEEIRDFYINIIGMEPWLSQPGIEILKYDNMLIGFHQQDVADTDSLLTFFYDKKEEVDQMYDQLQSNALSKPSENQKYKIYNFFAYDPESRKIEFQVFLHPLPSI